MTKGLVLRHTLKMRTYRLILPLLIVSLEGWAQTSEPSLGSDIRPDQAETGVTRPRDYHQWERKLTISEVRGGSYEASGVVKYYFKATLFGVIDTAEETALSLDKRRKVPLEVGTFGDIKIKSLESIKIGEKSPSAQNMVLDLTGDQLRGLVAKSMLDLGVKEGEVGVILELQMMRRTKKYGVLGQDTPVATASIPWGGQGGGPPQGGDSSLIRLEDEKGAHAVVKIVAKVSAPSPT